MTKDTKPEITLDMLKGAFAMRAEAYGHIFDVLTEEFSRDKAVELIGKATERLGKDMGEKFESFGPTDLCGLKDAFLSGIPAVEDMFSPEVIKCDNDRLEIQFHRCPLKDHWVEKGRNDEDIEHLCKAAGAIDGGLFTRAGFVFKGKTWKPGQSGCCRLIIEPGE